MKKKVVKMGYMEMPIENSTRFDSHNSFAVLDIKPIFRTKKGLKFWQGKNIHNPSIAKIKITIEAVTNQ